MIEAPRENAAEQLRTALRGDWLTRRALLGVAASVPLTSMMGAPAHAAGTGATPVQPNVLWIITDDQTRNMLPHMGAVMKRLAGKGQRFDRGYAAVPWCGPARASMLTSRYPSNHLCQSNQTHAPFVAQGHDTDTVATRIKAAGYRTGYFGKYMNGLGVDPGYIAPGWDRWVALVNASSRDGLFNVDGTMRTGIQDPDRFAAERCERFIRRNVTVPWFAVFAPTSPHDPYTPSAEHADDYDAVTWDPESLNEGDMSDKPSWMHGITMQSRARMRRVWEGKLEELQDTDDQVAAILTSLWRTGQLSNTFIFLVSDNGYLLGEHRLFKKEQPYEESSGVPFVVRGPGIATAEPTALVSQLDLMPTTLAIAGLDPDAVRVLDGRTMLPHLTSGDWTGWRQRLLVENPNRRWAMLCEGDTRFIDHYEAGERELYDLSTDPWQMRSQAATTDTTELAELVSLMRKASGHDLRNLENMTHEVSATDRR